MVERGNEFFIGLDLGQRQDHTAIAVVERLDTAEYRFDWMRYVQQEDSRTVRHDVRRLERMRLGTPYARVVERVGELAAHPAMAGRCSVVVDATGLGGPVVERLMEAELSCELIPVTITGAGEASRRGPGWSVPKADLMKGLQVMLQEGELRIARELPLASELRRELLQIRAEAGASGRVRYGAFGSGQHDDLALAVALACWRSRRPAAGEMGRRLI
jgi:hypothetical protein